MIIDPSPLYKEMHPYRAGLLLVRRCCVINMQMFNIDLSVLSPTALYSLSLTSQCWRAFLVFIRHHSGSRAREKEWESESSRHSGLLLSPGLRHASCYHVVCIWVSSMHTVNVTLPMSHLNTEIASAWASYCIISFTLPAALSPSSSPLRHQCVGPVLAHSHTSMSSSCRQKCVAKAFVLTITRSSVCQKKLHCQNK